MNKKNTFCSFCLNCSREDYIIIFCLSNVVVIRPSRVRLVGFSVYQIDKTQEVLCKNYRPNISPIEFCDPKLFLIVVHDLVF